MKKMCKRIIAFTLAMVMVLAAGLLAPQSAAEVQAASKVYINPYSSKVVTYKPGDGVSKYTSVISIMGCSKKSEIKNLKSSNKAVVKVTAQDGYIRAQYGNKAGKATITCTVKGVKLKTTLTVKKYSNPCSTFKIGSTNFTSKFNKDDSYVQKKAFKNQTLNIKLKSGWKITTLSVYNGKTTKRYTVNSSKFSKKITLNGSYGVIYVNLTNTKTGISECLSFTRTAY